ncbi:hypothetical protein ACHAXM_006770 [Skeletonema potamos]
MGRTAWWKRHSKSGSPTTKLVDTSCAVNVKVKNVRSHKSEDSSPPDHQLQKFECEPSDLADAVKGGNEQIPSANECEECDVSMELAAEQEYVDECSDHKEPSSVDDVSAGRQYDDVIDPESQTESEAKKNQSSLGDGSELASVPSVEAPCIERTDTEDSGESTVDTSAGGTQDSSAHATIAMSVTTNKTDSTDYTDDGILRDDEGNPVDLAEAEENMLRDDQGNIIDPKTLVTRESYLDLCCEEFCETQSHAIIRAENAQDECEIDEDTYVRFTLEAIISEMITSIEERDPRNRSSETCSMEDYEKPLKEGSNKGACTKEIDEADQDQEPNEAYDNLGPVIGQVSRTRRTSNASARHRSRQTRRGRTSPQQGADDIVHIMFNNTLSTLVEVASGSIDEESAEETEDEKSHISHNTTRSEKFFKARWNYSLQVMRREASTAQLIDARDEIDDMIRLKERIPDDRSVCSDEGTI